jgi:hypothetical protein
MARKNNPARSRHRPRRGAGQGARGKAGAAEMRYKIYTARSRRNLRLIKRWLRELELGFTLYRSEGGWVESAEKYVSERSMLIEIITPAENRANIRAKIKTLRKAITAKSGLDQKEVWVYEDELPPKWVIKQETGMRGSNNVPQVLLRGVEQFSQELALLRELPRPKTDASPATYGGTFGLWRRAWSRKPPLVSRFLRIWRSIRAA